MQLAGQTVGRVVYDHVDVKMYADGADVVYHAAGGSGDGLFSAAKEANDAGNKVWAIGVDSDQALTSAADLAPYILTSMIKRVDTAVYEAVKATKDGTFEGGQRVFGLAEEGVGYSTSNPALTSDIVDQLEAYKQQIIAGTIVVPTEP